MDYIPKKVSGFSYIREEENNHFTVRLENCPEINEMIINDISLFILDLCNGKNNISMIVSSILSQYKGAAYEEVYTDTIDTLENMWKSRLIEWVNDHHPFESKFTHNMGKYTIKRLTEKEMLQKQSLFDSKKILLDVNYLSDYNISPKVLKQLNFIDIQRLYSIYYKDIEIGTIIISMPQYAYQRNLKVKGLYIDENYLDSSIINTLNDLCKIEFAINNVEVYSGFSFTIYDNKNNSNFMNKLGFTLEGVQKNEIDNQTSCDVAYWRFV